MTFAHAFKTALLGLSTHRSRAILTIVGIVIGITAIMMVMSLGSAATNLILAQIQGMGSRTVVVMPGREPRGFSDIGQIFTDSLKLRDLEAIERQKTALGITRISPVVFGGESASFEGEGYRLTLFGVGPDMAEMVDLIPADGSFFTEEDVRSRADVAVIGAKVNEELFGGRETQALGSRIKIKNKSFRVIGVLAEKGQVSFFNFDEAALIPYTTAQQYVFGIKYVHRLFLEAATEKDAPRVEQKVTALLRSLHGIDDPEKDDFHVDAQVDIAARVGEITSVLTLFLAAVAAISLLVGGIGIMNIMLVSVTERTREIGLRKAIGASERDILTQFLLEAVILTGAGGILGILLGAALSFAASLALTRFVGPGWTFAFPVGATMLGLGVSAAVGLIFGLYPAREASRKSPIEALRYE